MRGKAYRRHKERAKWIRRVKYWMPKTPELWYRPDGIKTWYPDINECLDDEGFKVYKDMGTPCSCYMCSFGKYNRIEFKKDTKFQLKNSA